MDKTKWNELMLDAALKLALEEHLEQELVSLDKMAGESPSHVFSKQFERKMGRLIAKSRRSSRGWSYSVKRAAVVVLIFFAVSFCVAMTMEEVRAQIWNAVMEWSDKFIGFRHEIETAKPSMYLPEGFVEVTRDETRNSLYITYENGKTRDQIFLTDRLKTGASVTQIDNEKATYSQKSVQNVPVHIFTTNEDDGYNTVYWESGGRLLTLTSVIEINELEKITESLVKID